MFLVEDKIGIDWMKGRELKSRKKIILRLSTFIIIFFVFCLQYHQSGKISIELLDTETEGNNSDQEEESARKYSSYDERFIQPGDEISDGCRIHLARKPVFLPRSIRSYNESPLGKKREEQAQQVQLNQRNHVNNTENSKQETTNGDTNDKSSDE